MSVDNTAIKQSFSMDGVTTAFTLTISMLRSAPTDIKAMVINATGTASTLAYTTGYTVAVNADGDGGTISVADAQGATDTLFVYRETTNTQESDYEDFNQFPANTVETDMDRRTLKSQENDDEINRAVKFSITSDISDIEYPTPVDGSAMLWLGTGGTLVNSTFPLNSSATLAASSAAIAMAAATVATTQAALASSSGTVAIAQAAIATSEATTSTEQAVISTSEATTSTEQAVISASEATTSMEQAVISSSEATTSMEQAIISTSSATVAVAAEVAASSHATVAAGEAVLAASSATVSIDQAVLAASSATVSIDQAAISTSSATVSTEQAVISSSHATTAMEQATIATTQATIATTQATIATTQATIATAQATIATTQATIATAQAALAASSATVAQEIFDGLAVTTPGTAGCINIGIATTGATPTWETQCDFNNLFGSSGRATGGEVTSASTTSINIAAGTGLIKATDSDTAELLSFDWVAVNGVTVETNSTTYVKVSFNSGDPIVSTTLLEDWDLDTSWPLAKIVQETGDIYILNNPWWVTDGTTNIIERFESEGSIVRDTNLGGLIPSTDASGQLAVTAGKVWSRLTEFAISGISLGDDFYPHYRTTSTVWIESTASAFDVLKWNDLTTNTLEDLTNNYYANIWIYAAATGNIATVYPQAQYRKSADAEAEAPPTTLPKHISEQSILIGRAIVKQSITEPVQVQSAFDTTFAASQAADHGNLTGLGDDDHTQYLLTSGTRSQGTLVVTTSASIAMAILENTTAATLNVTTMATIAALTVSNIEITTGLADALTITDVDITDGIAAALTVSNIEITAGFATNLTVSNIEISAGSIHGDVTGTTQSALDDSTKLATTAYVDSAAGALDTFGNLTVTTEATIALLTAGTVNITGIMDAESVTAATLNVTTMATIAALTVSNIEITAGIADALTISNIEITNGLADAIKITDIEITGGDAAALTVSNIEITAGIADALTVSNIEITAGLATALTVSNIEITNGVADAITITDVEITGGEATSLTIGTLRVTTANITGLTVGTMTVTTSASIALLNVADATAGNLTVTTKATIAILESMLSTLGTISCGAITSVGNSSFNGAVVINESGADKDFRVESATNANNFFVDGANNRVYLNSNVGYITKTDITAFYPTFQVNDSANGGFAFDMWSTSTAHPAALWLSKSASNTIGTHVAQDTGATVAGIYFNASDGTDFECTAAVLVRADSGQGSGNVPGRIEFMTTPSGSATPVERLRVDSTGLVTLNNVPVFATNFKKVLVLDDLTIYISDGTTAEGALTGVEGDICLNGGTGAGQMAFCDAAGTNWTDM